jgi:hypothetical protein
MTRPNTQRSARSDSTGATVAQAVTVIIGVVVGLTFMFGFGNVLTLALHLGVPAWVAPLVAPAVDLSILGLLLGTRHLALHGATKVQLRPARRLLIFASITALALNVAAPVSVGAYGRAAFDAVGPLLLIGWAEVGPGLLQAINEISAHPHEIAVTGGGGPTRVDKDRNPPIVGAKPDERPAIRPAEKDRRAFLPEELLVRARREDAAHRVAHQRPISADTLRRRMAIGAKTSRRLVALVRSEAQAQTSRAADDLDGVSEDGNAQAA